MPQLLYCFPLHGYEKPASSRKNRVIFSLNFKSCVPLSPNFIFYYLTMHVRNIHSVEDRWLYLFGFIAVMTKVKTSFMQENSLNMEYTKCTFYTIFSLRFSYSTIKINQPDEIFLRIFQTVFNIILIFIFTSCKPIILNSMRNWNVFI